VKRIGILFFLMTALVVQAADQPNIVLILADDLGWTGLGCYDSEFYETPNIDELAEEGIRFDQAYAAATVCAPSRASLMSGQSSARHKITWVSQFQEKLLKDKKVKDLSGFRYIQPVHPAHLPEGTQTLGHALKAAGYTTAMFGKWHLGHRAEDQPDQMGFDEYSTFQGKHFGPKTLPDKIQHPDDVYLTDIMTDRALDFMERQAKRDEPFFLYFPDYLVHAPMQARQADLDYFAKKKPGKYQKSVMGAAMTKALDDTVGRILQKLDDLGIADDTLVLFTSDNGGLAYAADGGWPKSRSIYPLKGHKSLEFEGGSRVPLIARWPGNIPEGTWSHELVTGLDIYPTLLAIADADVPKGQILDGVDFSKILRFPKASLSDRDVFWYKPVYNHNVFGRGSVWMRRGKWKMIYAFVDETVELYNIENDISEEHNLVSQYPELAAEMQAAAFQWLEDTDAPRMVPNPDFNPAEELNYR
jgi:arylsulfatase A-like enzyme